ncbi:hypothetical protein EPUL_004594 [Erysiphe pulchra]|uniref:Uncharacterized protein n=1 Tax=Erysiphe pulchra TaxID=225359 RepID=A0A2S4PPM5_9PEZI|nr:hypothetical protein EPUL_004594 [Erysiphe pulchra]
MIITESQKTPGAPLKQHHVLFYVFNIQSNPVRQLQIHAIHSCREDHPCGAQNPTRVNTTSTVSLTSPTSSSTSGVAYTGLAGSESKDNPTSNKSGTLAALDPARGYLSAIIFACIFAGFAIIM